MSPQARHWLTYPSGLGHIYYEKDSYYTSEDGSLQTVAKDFSSWGAHGRPLSPPTTLHSIGGVYRGLQLLRFWRLFGQRKADGTGALRGIHISSIFRSLSCMTAGPFLCRDTLDKFTSPAKSRRGLKSDFQYYANVAKYVQTEIERTLLYLVNDRFERCPSRNLAYAGGVALNAVANSRILRETGFERLFIQPAAGDNGLAIGCAYYGWTEVLGQKEGPR